MPLKNAEEERQASHKLAEQMHQDTLAAVEIDQTSQKERIEKQKAR